MGLLKSFLKSLEAETGYKPEEITFGSYQGQPIMWKAIDASNVAPLAHTMTNGKFYISKKILFHMAFSEINRMVDAEYNIWKTSTLREYLNGEFYTTCFSDTEKTRIIPQDVISYGNTATDAFRELFVPKIMTTDYVFLPNNLYKDWVERRDSIYANCFWTRMTLSYHDGLADTIDKSKKTDHREVYILDQLERNGGVNQIDHYALKSKVDVEHGVRPVIFIANI